MSETSEAAAAEVAVEETDPVVIADKPREPTEYEKRLRRENASERVKRKQIEADLTAARKAIEEKEAAALAMVERARSETAAAMNERLMRAEMKAAALAAGMVDLDGLKLLDLSGVKLDEAGEVKIPEGFFDKAKAAKPYLFGAKATTSTPTTPPAAEAPAQKSAREMSSAELSALGRSLGIRV